VYLALRAGVIDYIEGGYTRLHLQGVISGEELVSSCPAIKVKRDRAYEVVSSS